ncbi:MAG: hypothetical protein HC888_00970 [Candidatus Competibacteraceae bacterium]|nr:hypothetical protein [Candidatus Competibacteraceae bacterium]
MSKKKEVGKGVLDPRVYAMDHGYRSENIPGSSQYASGAIKDIWPTPNHFLSNMMIPGISDAAGIAGDLQLMKQDESMRTPMNYGMMALGALPFVPGITKWDGPGIEEVVKGYRAQRLLKSRKGELFPAMIDNKAKTSESIPQGEWLKSEFMPTPGLKPRKGWHGGLMPEAPQFRGSKKGSANYGLEPDDMIWTEVDFNANTPLIDPSTYNPSADGTGKTWQELAEEYAVANGKKPYRAELPYGQGPDNGFYQYRNKSNDEPWIISDAARHNRIITDEEVADILRQYGIEPTPRFGGAWTPDTIKRAGLESWLK